MGRSTRRSFLQRAGAGTIALGPLAGKKKGAGAAAARDSKPTPPARLGIAHTVTEWAFVSGKAYADPFNDLELDVVFTGPEGRDQRVPAFWAGGQTWRVRFAPPSPGRYTFRTISADTSNPDLHGQAGVLEVSEYTGDSPLLKHGPVRVAADRRHFEHADGTAFFWLGDTWWMGLCRRLRWPADFQILAADRIRKGFTVVQIIAGLYPDMPPFDPRGANEAGYPWEANYARINPRYFDMADVRIQHLVDHGLVPCIVASWGYFIPDMGVERLKKHWRYLVARWGAHPVFWCLAGEGAMPYYLSKTKEADIDAQRRGWTEIGKYLRSIDPYHHPITIHPTDNARNQVEDQSVIDFDMLQTGHSDRASIPNTINQVTGSLTREPKMPVLIGEVCYEGILEQSRQEVQRFMFWASILSGSAGHTYGANGIWQVNTASTPFGPSPHGRSWGDTPWDVAFQLPGSEQIGLAKELLMRFQWWRFEPHPEWVEPHWSRDNYVLPYAAGIPGEVRVIFLPPLWAAPKLTKLEAGVNYRASFFSPSTGKLIEAGRAAADPSGAWTPPTLPTFADWVILLEKV